MILNVILITIIFSTATQLPGLINFSSAVFTASIPSLSRAPIPSINILLRTIITSYLLIGHPGYYSMSPSPMLTGLTVYENSSIQQIYTGHLSQAYYAHP